MKKYVQGGTRQVTLFHHVTGIGTGDRGGAALGALTLSLAHGGKNPRFLARIGVCSRSCTERLRHSHLGSIALRHPPLAHPRHMCARARLLVCSLAVLLSWEMVLCDGEGLRRLFSDCPAFLRRAESFGLQPVAWLYRFQHWSFRCWQSGLHFLS
jgi:hypothetical protein